MFLRGPKVRAMPCGFMLALFSNNAYPLGIYFTFRKELVSPSQQWKWIVCMGVRKSMFCLRPFILFSIFPLKKYFSSFWSPALSLNITNIGLKLLILLEKKNYSCSRNLLLYFLQFLPFLHFFYSVFCILFFLLHLFGRGL